MFRIKYFLCALFLLPFLFPAAAAAAGSAPEAPVNHAGEAGTVVESAAAETAETAHCYKPVGEWTGRLILPGPQQREADGSVFIKISNSPSPDLAGKVIKLRWNVSKEEDCWFDVIRPNIKFSPGYVNDAAKDGMLALIPLRLDGWRRVSALESLAGARAADDVEVHLKNAVYSEGSLYINDEPVQISGSKTALIQFDGPARGNLRTAVHYNPATGSFDGPRETIYVLASYKIPGKDKIVSSTIDIEKTQFNSKGFYIYGEFMKTGGGENIFVIKALMPRSLHLVEASQLVHGKSDTKHYYSRRHFKDLVPGMFRSTMVVPEKNAEISIPAAAAAYTQQAWPVGTRGLLVHIFGWRKNIVTGKTDLPGPRGLHAGHFAFGSAEVINDPFTGEKRFDIEYKQVYAHGDGGIVSGSMKWHNYMGDIKRGWMYTVPVSDTIIQIPEMQPYDIDGWRIDPMRGFARMTEIMMAVYRTGGGRGISKVTPYISCVQDSHYALYGALVTFEKHINSDPRCAQWLSGSATGRHPDAGRFEALSRLVKSVKDRITIIGLSRHDWKSHFDNPLGTRDPGPAAQAVLTLLSLKTVFPRDAHDNIMFLGANKQYRMWSVISSMCGGRLSEFWPLAPNSLITK